VKEQNLKFENIRGCLMKLIFGKVGGYVRSYLQAHERGSSLELAKEYFQKASQPCADTPAMVGIVRSYLARAQAKPEDINTTEAELDFLIQKYNDDILLGRQ
jgi:hypothetical protein